MNKNINAVIKGTIGALATALALAFPLVANAENFYVDLGLGQANADLDLGGTTGLNVDDTDTAYSIGAGYKFNDDISIEGGYLKLGTASVGATGTVSGTYYGSPFSATGTLAASAEVDGFYLGPVLNLPFAFADKFEVYARAGVYFWDLDAKASASGTLTYDGITYAGGVTASRNRDGNDTYYGIGAAYKATENVSVGADWTRYDIDGIDVGVLVARLKYSY